MSRLVDAGPSSPSPSPSTSNADRSALAVAWYRLVQVVLGMLFMISGGLRATGRRNVPRRGAAILVSNHLSHLDVLVLGLLLHRPLNYVARSTLFLPVLGPLIRSVGAFPIQREGMGASGLKETLRRLRNGGMVTLFPEGTRSRDGELAELKTGIAVLVARAKVPIVPAAVAGTFEAWPRDRTLPRPYPTRAHFGPPIVPADLEGRSTAAITDLIRDRIQECHRIAEQGVARDLGGGGNCDWPGGPF